MSKATNPAHDLSTASGLLAAFDAEVTRLNEVNRWCDSGRRYPYEMSGNADDGQYRIPRPGQRTTPAFASGLLDVPDEFLSDAGKAAKSEADTALLGRIRDGIKSAAERSVNGGYITAAQVNESLANLGFPAGTSVQTRTVSVNVVVYGTVDGKTRAIKNAPEMSALQDAIRGMFPDGSVTWARNSSADYGHVDIGGTSTEFTVANPA